MTNHSVAPAEHAEAGNIGVFRVHASACVRAGRVRSKSKIRKTALLLVFDQTLDGGRLDFMYVYREFKNRLT
jgi:hypothetical protein